MARVVLDTNVLVSAIIGHGKPRRLLRWVLRHHIAVSSIELIAELSDVLAREKFSLTERQTTRFLAIYMRRSDVVGVRRRIDVVREDPDDNIVLEAAVNGSAEFVVTGDKHLLGLREFEDVRIITADEALKVLSSESL